MLGRAHIAVVIGILAMVSGSAAASTCPAIPQMPRRQGIVKEIVLVESSWLASALNNKVLKILLEQHLGYTVVEKLYEDDDQKWDDMGETKTVDIDLEVWAGSDLMEQKYQLEKKSVVRAGSLGITGGIGWYTQNWVPQNEWDYLDYWRAYTVNSTAKLFHNPNITSNPNRGSFVSGPVAWDPRDEALINGLGLPFDVYYPADYQEHEDMVYKMGTDTMQPHLFYMYTPHALMTVANLTRVTLPPKTPLCAESMYAEGCFSDYEPEFPYKMFRVDIPRDVEALVIKMTLTTEGQSWMLAKSHENPETDLSEIACEWIQMNKETVLTWLPLERTCDDGFKFDTTTSTCIESQDGAPYDGTGSASWWTAAHIAAVTVPIAAIIAALTLWGLLSRRRANQANREIVKERAERLLMEASQRERVAQDRLEIRNNFLRFLMHEIRVPFHVVTVGVDSTLTHSQLDDGDRETLEAVQQASSMISTLLDDVLDLQRIDDRKLVVESDPFNLVALINYVSKQFAVIGANSDIQLITTFQDVLLEGGLYNGDKNRISQCISNIISNALKFSKPGSSIILRTAIVPMPDADTMPPLCTDTPPPPYELQISVADTGAGIPADKMHQLFTTYSQIDAGKLQSGKGSGLGLSISKAIMVAMKGDIHVRSEPGKGSTFTLRLPLPQATLLPPLVASNPAGIPLDAWTKSCQAARRLAAAISTPKHGGSATGTGGSATGTGQGSSLASGARGTEKPGPVLHIRPAYECVTGSSASHSVSEMACGSATELESIELRPGANFVLPDQSTITVPIDPPTSNPSTLSSQRKSQPGTSTLFACFHDVRIQLSNVLLVDDIALVLKVTKQALANHGFSVETCSRGAAALQLVNASANPNRRSGCGFDFVLVDKEMPEMDGYEVARELKRMFPKLFVIGCSGNALRSDVEDFIAAGADAVCPKPLKMELLAMTLQDLVTQYGIGEA